MICLDWRVVLHWKHIVPWCQYVLRSGFSWVSSLVWCLLHFSWMTSCTYDMPRSACSVLTVSLKALPQKECEQKYGTELITDHSRWCLITDLGICYLLLQLPALFSQLGYSLLSSLNLSTACLNCSFQFLYLQVQCFKILYITTQNISL
jgi:hypothetical protein